MASGGLDLLQLVAPIVANRFSDLARYQEDFLLAAARHVEVWLALPWQQEVSATRALDGLVERLTRDGAELVVTSPRQYTKSEELRHLEARLFEADSRPEDTPRCGHVRLSEAYGEEAEALRIAAEIQLALAEGIPAEQIAVVFQNASEHVASLRSAFAEAGIMADFDVVRAVRDTGWGRAFAHLAEFAGSGTRTALAGFLRSPYSGLARDQADQLEARWRQRGIDRPDRLRATLREASPQAGDLLSLMDALLRSGAATPRTCQKWKILADALLRNAYGVGASLLDGEGLADASAQRALMQLVGSLGESGLQIDGAELVRAFLETEVAVTTPRRRGSVHVLSASRARSQRFRVVIIGGLSSGDFPRSVAENPLRTPRLATELATVGVELARLDERDAARLVFYLVASRATERLVLSRQVAASDGSERAPSWLLDEMLDLYRHPEAEDVDEKELPPRSVLRFDGQGTEHAAPDSVRRGLRERAASRSVGVGPPAGGVLGLAIGRAEKRMPMFADDRVLSQLFERQVFSATEIESYLRCPYGWFHERIVRAEALEPEADALQRGRLCHQVLRQTYDLLPEAVGSARVTSQNLEAALGLARGVVDRAIEQDGGADSLSRRALNGELQRRVIGFIRCDACFLPSYEPVSLEWGFTPDTHAFDGFQLKGRIDRIDRGPDGRFLVIDYKTGTVGSNHSARKFEQRGLVQLALYARIVEDAFGGAVVGGLYRGVTWKNASDKQNRGFYLEDLAGDPGLRGTDKQSADEIRELLEGAERRAAIAVAGIREGRIAAEPLDPASCQKCRLAGFCPRSAR